MPWWEQDPAALRREIRALQRAGFRPTTHIVSTLVALSITHRGRRYEIDFNDNYLRGGSVNAFRLGTDGKSIERVARVYREDATRAALEAIQLVMKPDGSNEVMHGQVIVPHSWQHPSGGPSGTLSLGGGLVGSTLAAIGVTGLRDATQLSRAGSELRRAFPKAIAGLWARAESWPSWVESRGAEVAMIENRIAAAHDLSVSVVRARLETEVGAVLIGADQYARWRFARRSTDGGAMLLATLWYDAHSLQQRAPYSRQLSGKRVTIIGCGAVGWAAATFLARSGVRRFALYDDDRIDVGNLARLGARLGQVGEFKVDALARELQSMVPSTNASALPYEVGRGVGAAALVGEESDLLINVTGEELSTLETNRASLVTGKPALFAWVSNGVWSGRIFRVRPFETPCYECVRESQPAALPSLRERVGRPWIGSVIDVQAFAALVAAAAVRTLLASPVSDVNADHMVLDFLTTPPRSRQEVFLRDPGCAECGTRARGVR